MISNILIIDESTAGQDGLELGSAFVSKSYVYCAYAGCRELTDTEEGIRCLPLDPVALPAFGDLDGVFVFGSPLLFESARRTYRGAPVIASNRHQIRARQHSKPHHPASALARRALEPALLLTAAGARAHR